MSAETELKLQLKGSELDDGHVRLPDFIVELQALQEALAHTDRFVIGRAKPSTKYRVVALSHNSPATLTFEAFPSDSQADDVSPTVLREFLEIWTRVANRLNLSKYPASLLESFRKIALPLGQRLREIVITYADKSIVLHADYVGVISLAIAREDVEIGSLQGMLETINIHGEANSFRIYPTVGPVSVTCLFSQGLKDKALKAIGRYVEVEGQLFYKPGESFPHQLRASDIVVLPEENELPSLFDLMGIAPKATGGKLSEDFTNDLRQNDW